MHKSVSGGAQPSLPLIVVGSVLAGGAGKTPLCAELARSLRVRGLRVGIMAHAVHGRFSTIVREVFPDSLWQESSDEAVWLARSTGVRVWVTRDRWAAWEALENMGLDVLLSDDGFEDPRLSKAQRIMLPAHCAAQTIGDLIPGGKCRSLLRDHLGTLSCDPIFMLHEVKNHQGQSLDAPAMVVCGIGDPLRFEADLMAFGVLILGRDYQRDHSPLVARRVRSLLAQGVRVVTTEKDYIRLDRSSQADPLLFVARQVVHLPTGFLELLQIDATPRN